MRNARARQRGWTFLDTLLTSVTVSMMLAGAMWMAMRQQQEAKVQDTLGIVKSIVMQEQLARTLYAEGEDGQDFGYTAGQLGMGALPEHLLENATELRNPLGMSNYMSAVSGTGGDGSPQYVFWFFDIPRWACADLVMGLSDLGFVMRGNYMNRSPEGRRIPISVTRVQTGCAAQTAGTVPTIILIGPAPN